MICPKCGMNLKDGTCPVCGYDNNAISKPVHTIKLPVTIHWKNHILEMVFFFIWTIYIICNAPEIKSQIGLSRGIFIYLFGVVLWCSIAFGISHKFLQKNLSPRKKNKIKENVIKDLSGRDSISPTFIMRKYKTRFNDANEILNDLEQLGYVGKQIDYSPRKILKNKTASTVKNFDSMSGHEFEYFCADILKKNMFINVEVIPGSGDHGIDILAEKDGISYAIQCKCYSKDIGNAAVQQAHTGKSIYKKDIAVVLTNRNFTSQAKEEAAVLGVKLWDREKLLSMAGNLQ